MRQRMIVRRKQSDSALTRECKRAEESLDPHLHYYGGPSHPLSTPSASREEDAISVPRQRQQRACRGRHDLGRGCRWVRLLARHLDRSKIPRSTAG